LNLFSHFFFKIRVVGNERLDHITPTEFNKLSSFHHYTFTSVLRLDKYLTLFDPVASENSYFVVPLKAMGYTEDGPISSVELDWDFLDRIWKEKDTLRPVPVSNYDRQGYKFHRENYMDAVVTPWYRNNDQPQFFYVAEICANLTPMSQFPGEIKRQNNLTIDNNNVLILRMWFSLNFYPFFASVQDVNSKPLKNITIESTICQFMILSSLSWMWIIRRLD